MFPFAVALLLRLYRLGTQSLWSDEAFSFVTASKGVVGSVLSSLKEAAIPPLHYVLLSLLLHFGRSEWWLRLPSAIFGALSVLALFLLLGRFSSSKVAVAGSVLLAVHPFHIWFSQEARPYALLCLLSLLSMWAFLEAAREEGRTRWLLAYAVFTALLPLAHHPGLFVVASEALLLPLMGRRKKALACALLLSMLPYALWTAAIHRAAGEVLRAGPRLDLRSIGFCSLKVAIAFCTDIRFGPFLLTPVGAGAFVFALLGTLGLALLGLLRGEAPPPLRALLALSLTLGWFFPSLTAGVRPTLPPRYAIPALQSLVGLLALGMGSGRRPSPLRLLAPLTFLPCWAISLYRVYFDPTCWRDNWRGAASFLREHFKPGDVIVAVPRELAGSPVLYYAPEVGAVIGLDEWRRMPHKPRRAWLVGWHSRPVDERLNREMGGRIALERRWGPIRIALFVRAPSKSARSRRGHPRPSAPPRPSCREIPPASRR